MNPCELQSGKKSDYEIRRIEIGRALFEDSVKAATLLRIRLGAEGILDPNNVGLLKEVFGATKISSLTRMGVLDEEGNIISGQEMYLDTRMFCR